MKLNFRFGSKARPFISAELPASMPFLIDEVDEELERICGEKPFDEHEFREHLSQLEDRP